MIDKYICYYIIKRQHQRWKGIAFKSIVRGIQYCLSVLDFRKKAYSIGKTALYVVNIVLETLVIW